MTSLIKFLEHKRYDEVTSPFGDKRSKNDDTKITIRSVTI